MSIWNAILLGLVQGIAEFLPISSSGHLSILQNLFHMSTTENGHLFFDVLLHLGTLISICIVYWRDIVAMVRETFAFFRNTRLPAEQRQQQLPAARMVLMIILATLPLFLILPINDQVEQLYYHTFFIGLMLILTGFLLFVADKMPKGTRTEKNMRVRRHVESAISPGLIKRPEIERQLSVPVGHHDRSRHGHGTGPQLCGALLVSDVAARGAGCEHPVAGQGGQDGH